MKSLSPGLSDHLRGEVTTLAHCWKLIRSDGVIFGFTDHDRDIELGGQVYEAASGLTAGEFEQTLGFNSDTQEVSGALISDRITASDIRADRYDAAQIELWFVNWSSPDERVLDRVFQIGEIFEEDGRFRAELRGFSSGLNQTRGRYFSRNCDADLGDSRCGVDTSDPRFRGSAQILSVRSPLIVEVAGLTGFEAGWFRAGRVQFGTGANAGMGMEIAEHSKEGANDILQFWKPMPFSPELGDAMTVTAGCDKTFGQCAAKFANSDRFRGFPHMPGNDFALGYASSLEIMDGGAIFP